jgi:ribosome maturation factor RimP
LKHTALERDELFLALDPLVRGATGGQIALLELKKSRYRGSATVSVTVYKPGMSGPDAVVSINDCRRVHQAIEARVNLAFDGADVTLEVSSPGIDRKIGNAAEFPLWLGRGVRVYRTDISDWSAGLLKEAGENYILLEGKDGMKKVAMDCIAKAKLFAEAEEPFAGGAGVQK